MFFTDKHTDYTYWRTSAYTLAVSSISRDIN